VCEFFFDCAQNPEGATDTRVGNSSRASGGRLGMGDSVAASEGGDDEAALQAQRKRPRTSSIGEVALVRQRLLACAFPGVQDNTQVPQLKVLLFEHGLATRLVCPERELWKANGTPAESKWHGVHVACAWKAWLDSKETPAALLRRGVDAGASAPTTRGAAEHEAAGCGEAGGGFKDARRAARAPSCEGLQGQKPCAPSIFLFNTVCVVSPPLALCISHPLPIPRGPSCPRARVYVCDGRGGKRSKVSPRGALNLPAARFLQTGRFDPLFPPPPT
jgi:hypothetical protein